MAGPVAPSSDPHRYSLDDRYLRDDGRVFLSGTQALARLPLEQLRVDRIAGWNTAAYVTGYPGSPLAGYDKDVRAVAALAEQDGHRLVFQPGLNEELAATAVMGSQLSVTLASRRYDGVIGIWYGKGPGLDRASDAIRHAVFAGTSSRGGAVALVGDDPNAKSSTIPSSSDATLVDLHIPVLYPGDVQEALDLGRHAIALSRACGLWTSIKVVEAVADGTGTVDLHPERIRPVIPTMEVDGATFVPQPSGKLLTPYTLQLEHEFHHVRLELARRYGVENHLNTVAVRGPHDWIGVVATGHTYREAMEALRLLGFEDDDALRDAGIRILKLGLPVPLDPALVRQFAAGLGEIVVVEEKNPTLEWFVKDALYSQNERPIVCGKHAPDGSPLLPPTGTLTADSIAPRLRSRLAARLGPDRLAPEPARPNGTTRELIPLTVNRTPYFCSGCPHNTSTRTPDGALVGGGIGCHSMVMFMEPERVGNIVGLTAMGNEGAQWFGIAPFVDDHRIIQNIGDGTLFHSGLLAVRAAIANGVDMTYKVLYNGAVAMTGGQDPFGQLDVPSLVTVLLAEGVGGVIVTTDDPSRYRDAGLPASVRVWDRSRIVEAQEVLAQVSGVTVLIHDQRCAAELRRDRKRGRATTPGFRVVIDERVCEGCGDCSDQSNCLSVQPHATPFGRKTKIDQASCNLDLSCLRGDCPSFLTVEPARRRRGRRPRPERTARPRPDAGTPLADPVVVAPTDECTIRMSGIGGTGVVTVSQVLGTAAMLDGYHVRGLDQTGLSQKAGPVVSDVRLSRRGPRPSNRATGGSVDVLIAFDMLVAATDTHLAGLAPERTIAIASSAQTPTGSMVTHPATPFPTGEVRQRLRARTQSLFALDAVAATTAATGDPATANIYLLGAAVQRGAVPVAAASIERAIELNGVAVDKNLAAFRHGRRDAAAATDGIDGPVDGTPDHGEVDAGAFAELLALLADDLAEYQDRAAAEAYLATVERARSTGSVRFARAVAVQLHRLTAYKDEYEVARLLLLPSSRAAAEAVAGPGARVSWNLHPPLLRSMGLRRKLRLGRWATPLLWALRAGRRLRGTRLDPFGYAAVRRLERRLAREYRAAIDEVIAAFDRIGEDTAVRIAGLPESVRGYEHLKLSRGQAFLEQLERELAELRRAP